MHFVNIAYVYSAPWSNRIVTVHWLSVGNWASAHFLVEKLVRRLTDGERPEHDLRWFNNLHKV